MNNFYSNQNFLAFCNNVLGDGGKFIYHLTLYINTDKFPPLVNEYGPKFGHVWRGQSIKITPAKNKHLGQSIPWVNNMHEMLPSIIDYINETIEESKVFGVYSNKLEQCTKVSAIEFTQSSMITLLSYILEIPNTEFKSTILALNEKLGLHNSLDAGNAAHDIKVNKL